MRWASLSSSAANVASRLGTVFKLPTLPLSEQFQVCSMNRKLSFQSQLFRRSTKIDRQLHTLKLQEPHLSLPSSDNTPPYPHESMPCSHKDHPTLNGTQSTISDHPYLITYHSTFSSVIIFPFNKASPIIHHFREQ